MTANSSSIAERSVSRTERSTPHVTPVEVTRDRVTRVATVVWYACGATIVAWAAGYLSWPFSNDQGNLAWVGDVVRHGGLPYRDAWDVKGPAAHLMFALAGVFGRNEWGLRLFDLIVLSLGVWATWRIASRYGSPTAARWTIALYLLWYASLDHHATAQPDGWAAVLGATAVAVVVTRNDRPGTRAAALAGVLIGVAALIKPTYALLLAVPIADVVAHVGIASRARLMRVVMAAVGGFTVPVVACVAWFAYSGALGAWRDVHLVWIPTSYAALKSVWLNRLQYVGTFLTTDRFGPAVALAIAGMVLVRRSSRPRDVVALAVWLTMVVAGVTMQGQFYAYHWHPLYPPLAVLAGLSLGAVLGVVGEQDRSRAHRQTLSVGTAVALAVAAVSVGGALIEPVMHVYRQARFTFGLMDGGELDRIEFGPFGHHTGVFPQIVAHIRSSSRAADRVLVWGSAAGINYLSGRASPSRFGFVQPLVDPPDSELRRRYRADFMRDLTRQPPRYVVSLNEAICADDPTSDRRREMGRAEGLIRCLGDIPGVRTYVLDHYEVERTVGSLEIRRWR